MWAFLYGIFYFFLALLGWDEDLPPVGRKARQSIRMELAFLGLMLLLVGFRDLRHSQGQQARLFGEGIGNTPSIAWSLLEFLWGWKTCHVFFATLIVVVRCEESMSNFRTAQGAPLLSMRKRRGQWKVLVFEVYHFPPLSNFDTSQLQLVNKVVIMHQKE